MKIIIPGGSGQIGTVLARDFHANGHEVVVLSRLPVAVPWRSIEWDGENAGPWEAEIDGANVVINLAGRSVNCRYNSTNRRIIKESRLRSTAAVGHAIAKAARPPAIWLQASTATIYAHRFDAANDEHTGVIGLGDQINPPDTWRFSIDVAKSWEQAAIEIDTPQTRKVLLRTAIVMSPDRGGAFNVHLNLVRFGLGGTFGDGRQYVSWIHDRDFIRALQWIIAHEELSGPVNVSSPTPLPNAEFMRGLRQAWGATIGLPAAKWMLEVGTFLMRSESELVLKSRRVIPARLVESGFTFEFPTWVQAAADLCKRSRSNRAISDS